MPDIDATLATTERVFVSAPTAPYHEFRVGSRYAATRAESSGLTEGRLRSAVVALEPRTANGACNVAHTDHPRSRSLRRAAARSSRILGGYPRSSSPLRCGAGSRRQRRAPFTASSTTTRRPPTVHNSPAHCRIRADSDCGRPVGGDGPSAVRGSGDGSIFAPRHSRFARCVLVLAALRERPSSARRARRVHARRRRACTARAYRGGWTA